MPKAHNKFRYSDWEWIVVHFPPAERKDMARTAWLIAQCSADEIAKHKNLDPRIVIPLCAIEFQDEINWEKLIEFKKEKQYFINNFIDDFEDSPSVTNFKYFQNLKQQQIVNTNFVKSFISQISDSVYWKNLFSSLELKLQIDLLHQLSDSERRPKRNHWRYIFQESKDYKFQKSWYYWLVRIYTLLFLVFAILAMKEVIYKQQNFWINGLIELALYILILFWVVPKQDPEHFIKFGLLGLLTFQRGLDQLLSNNLVKPNINIFATNLDNNIATEAVTRAVVLVLVVSVAGAGVGVEPMAEVGVEAMALVGAAFGAVVGARAVVGAGSVTVAVSGSEAWAWAVLAVVALLVIGTGDVVGAAVGAAVVASAAVGVVAGAAVGVEAGTVAVTGAVTVAVTGVVALAMAGAVTGALVGILLSIGILTWYGRKNNQNYFRFLAIFTFPLFCWFPILVSFATIFLLRFFSWQHTMLIWLISLSTCTSSWLYGQDKDNKARNPLKGLL